MPDPSRWNVEEYQPSGEAQEYVRRPRNSAHDGHGNMVLRAVRETSPRGAAYTSARLSNQFVVREGMGYKPFFRTYGRWSARMWLPNGQGVWPAWWTLGDYTGSLPAGWPACGEIDILESLNFGEVAHGGVHTVKGDGTHFARGITPTRAGYTWTAAWHVWTIDWRPGSITWLVDGKVRGKVTRRQVQAAGGVWVFDGLKPQSPILNLAVGGWAGTPGGWSEQTMLIDWVRVYP